MKLLLPNTFFPCRLYISIPQELLIATTSWCTGQLYERLLMWDPGRNSVSTPLGFCCAADIDSHCFTECCLHFRHPHVMSTNLHLGHSDHILCFFFSLSMGPKWGITINTITSCWCVRSILELPCTSSHFGGLYSRAVLFSPSSITKVWYTQFVFFVQEGLCYQTPGLPQKRHIRMAVFNRSKPLLFKRKLPSKSIIMV